MQAFFVVLIAAAMLLQQPAAPSPALDYEFFKTKIQPTGPASFQGAR